MNNYFDTNYAQSTNYTLKNNYNIDIEPNNSNTTQFSQDSFFTDSGLKELTELNRLPANKVGSRWLNKKKRKTNPLLSLYLNSNPMHPSRYSSLDYIRGNGGNSGSVG